MLLNFTNPEARVLHAICHLTHVRAAGICHGVFTGLRSVSHYLNKPVEELDIVSASFGGVPSVTFDEMGAPSSAGSIMLQAGPHALRVDVSSATGSVTVVKTGW